MLKAGYHTAEERRQRQNGQIYDANWDIRALMRKRHITMKVLSKELGIQECTLIAWMKREDLPENIHDCILETVNRLPEGKRPKRWKYEEED